MLRDSPFGAMTPMCRISLVVAATAALCLAAPDAWAKKKDKEKPGSAAVAAAGQSPSPAPRVKATAEQRAIANQGDPLARAAFWTREVDIDPRDVPATLALTQALRALGSYEDAAQVTGRLLMLEPNNVEGLLEMARIHIARLQGFYGIEPGRKAQALAPRDWRPPALLAVAYEQANRPDEALAAHRQAQAIAPNNPSVLSNLAMFLATHGDPPQAEKLLRTAAALPGASVQVRQNLALVVGLQGRFDEAERLARQDLPPEVVANNMAYLHNVAGGGEAAGPVRDWNSLRTQP